jgi:YD repeat-containing protein
MKTPFLALVLLGFLPASAQYYFKDIIGTQKTNQQMKTFVANNVKTITAAGYDPSGMKTNDFSEFQEVKENGQALKISSHNNSTNTVYYNRFDAQGRLTTIIDSSSYVLSVTTYEYDAKGNITQVKNVTKDTANDFNQVEVHQWIYDLDNQPIKMWRIINNTDSLEIRFKPDENGNVGDETIYRRGVENGTIYYYYDEKHRLTDIVRFNVKAKKLLPDIMFEYDDSDRVIQEITTTSSLNISYLIWRYLYNEKGLKTKEALFNHTKELTGKIEYTYAFAQ